MSLKTAPSAQKVCSICRTSKPATSEFFRRSSSRPDGLDSACKPCRSAGERKVSYAVVEGGERVCTRCQIVRARTLEHFQRNSRMRDGMDSYCRECVREIARNRQRERRADPVERVKLLEEKRRYAASAKGRESKRLQSEIDNHRRQERTSRHPFSWSAKDWRKIKIFWGDRCAYCDMPEDVNHRKGRLTQDHFLPVSWPACPGTQPSNIVPACISCNASKCDKDPYEWHADSARIDWILSWINVVQIGAWRLPGIKVDNFVPPAQPKRQRLLLKYQLWAEYAMFTSLGNPLEKNQPPGSVPRPKDHFAYHVSADRPVCLPHGAEKIA